MNQNQSKPKKGAEYSPFDYIDKPQRRYLKTEWYARKLKKDGERVGFDKELQSWYWEPKIHFHFYKYHKKLERSKKQPTDSHVTLADMSTLHIFKNSKLMPKEYFEQIGEHVIRELLCFQKAIDNDEFETFHPDDVF